MRRFMSTFAEVPMRFEVAYSEMHGDTRAVVTCLDIPTTSRMTYILKDDTFMAMHWDPYECREIVEKNFMSKLLHQMYSEMIGELVLETD